MKLHSLILNIICDKYYIKAKHQLLNSELYWKNIYAYKHFKNTKTSKLAISKSEYSSQ